MSPSPCSWCGDAHTEVASRIPVMAAAWVSPELSASYLSRTQAGARQGTALLGENGAETSHPVGMRPIYFPFTHHTWDQPGGG